MENGDIQVMVSGMTGSDAQQTMGNLKWKHSA